MSDNSIIISEKDYFRLRQILDHQSADDFEDLEVELDRARIISDDDLPNGLVRMNSRVKFLKVEDNKVMELTLVYPAEADVSAGKVSILASLGSALIGLREGQEIRWMFPDGKTRTIRILEVN